MTKRCGNYENNNNSNKKPKLDDDEPWDDDLDDEELDRCFEIASQAAQENVVVGQSKNNVTIMPSYSSFKNPSHFASSTQLNTIPSTSKSLSLYELETEIRRLKQQNEEKDGEICILRSKIKETTTSIQVEQQKTTNEWREKLQVTQKDLKVTKSDLDFKNLEVANLKQQIAELRRANLDATLNSTQQFVTTVAPVKVNERPSTSAKKDPVESSQRVAITVPIYPLKGISPAIFENHHSEEKHIQKLSFQKHCLNSIPFLQNKQTYSLKHRCPKIDNCKLDLDLIYPEVMLLVNQPSEDLNSADVIASVNKILLVAILLLQDLNDYLSEFGSYMKSEDIQQADANYLLDEREQLCDISVDVYKKDELGIKSGKVLEFLSQLILYNKHLADFVCFNRPLKLTESFEKYFRFLKYKNGVLEKELYPLNLILCIVSNIGKYRKASIMNGFLLSVTKLLVSIAKLGNIYLEELIVKTDIFCKIFKEIIFTRPGALVLQKITLVLKVCSSFDKFVSFLFSKNGKEPLVDDPKRVLYYNESACPFCVLDMLVQNTLLKANNLPLDTCYNMTAFIYNTLKHSQWIHHQSSNIVCVCLSQLYKLVIEFIFKALQNFKHHRLKKNKADYEEWSAFLRHEVVQNVLCLMTFNNYELTEKSILIYSQYKEIERFLKSEGQFMQNVMQPNTSEETLKISDRSFIIDF